VLNVVAVRIDAGNRCTQHVAAVQDRRDNAQARYDRPAHISPFVRAPYR
jgi:hypothetical protein